MMSRMRTAAATTLLLVPIVAGGFLLQEPATRTSVRLFDQVRTLIETKYVDSLKEGQLFEKAAKGMVRELNDPYSELRYSGDPVIVEKKGRPFAVLISPEDFERFQQLAKEQFFETVREIQQDNKDADPDEVLRDVTEAVEAVRREEYERNTPHRP